MPLMTFRLPGGRRVQVSDVPNDDDVLTFDIVTNTWDSEPAQGGGAEGFSTKFKTIDEIINNDNVLTDDTDLQFEAEANGVYAIKLFIFYTIPSAADLQYTFVAPSGALGKFISDAAWSPAASRNTSSLLDKIVVTTSNKVETTTVYVSLRMGGTAGTFAFQWAQNSSQSDDTTLFKGSWMDFKKLN